MRRDAADKSKFPAIQRRTAQPTVAPAAADPWRYVAVLILTQRGSETLATTEKGDRLTLII